ncbi:MAG TPA: HAD family hydrolase [Pyrinomonadaceae bacterium]|jgi:HAD superfamily hydrolase (TIGR01509 family)
MNKRGNNIKAVIFDIDGTLIDSNDAHAESFVHAFQKFGKTVPFVELKWLIGMGADKILEKYLTKREISDFGEDLTEYRKKIFLKDYLPELKVFPKMRQLLEKLNEDGVRLALASSASAEELEKYHEILKIDDLLDEETSSDDAEESKPDPDIFQAALGKLKEIENREALVVGDTPYDAEASKKARLKIVGVKSGGWSREKLMERGCFEVYADIGEIYANYERVFSPTGAEKD